MCTITNSIIKIYKGRVQKVVEHNKCQFPPIPIYDKRKLSTTFTLSYPIKIFPQINKVIYS